MYHEIQAEDETHSKKSASSAIKSRSRVKSMSQPIYTYNSLFTRYKKWIRCEKCVEIGLSNLDILFTLLLLFILLETDFLLYVLSPAWISWYIFSTLFTIFRPIKSTLYSVFYIEKPHHQLNLSMDQITERALLNKLSLLSEIISK